MLQNRAAQIVLGCPPRTSRDLMFSKLGWLTVRQLIGYHTLIVIYRIRQSHQPEQLAAKLTKDNRQGRIMLKNVQLGLYRNGFIYRGSVLWNKLPENLRNEKKLGPFKRILKSWIEANLSRFDE